MRRPKRSGQGFVEHRALIGGSFGQGTFDAIRKQHGSYAVDDDILDALAATWTALRIQRGHAQSIPDSPQIDALGLMMAMWV